MRFLILSDVHANLHALEAVLADADAIGYDAVLCLGDLVGYGGSPAATIDRVLALEPAGLVRGNHDKVCCGLEPPARFNDDARYAAEWTERTLTAPHVQALATLPRGPLRVGDDVEICHGAPFDEDYYVFDDVDAARALTAASARICLYGHTHVPAAFFSPQTDHSSPDTRRDELPLPREGRMLVNVGSVGQPRDGDPRAAYGLLDLDESVLRLKRVSYDVEGAQAAIHAAGLPARLAYRLAHGR